MEEIWKQAPGFALYEVSNLGRLRNIESGKVFIGTKRKLGYMATTLKDGDKWRTIKVHRLVALAFVPNPDNLRDVNHIDEDTYNNRADNLEWCTPSYNSRYGEARTKMSVNSGVKKKIEVLDEDGNIVTTYGSVKEACDAIGISRTYLARQYKAKGYAKYHGKILRYVKHESLLNEKAVARAFEVFPKKIDSGSEWCIKSKRDSFVRGYFVASEDAISWLKANADQFIDCYADRCGLINAFERELGMEETEFED